MIEPHRVVGGLIGLAVGDALGVPVDFESRDARLADPVIDMRGGGAHGQPPGTWSDGTSLAFCTVDALLTPAYSVERLARNFALWLSDGFWSPRGEIFDVGGPTRAAILRIMDGEWHGHSGSDLESDNDNGSLVRILPVIMAFSRRSIPLMLERVHQASAVTHAHPRSLMGCGIYALVVRNLLFRRSTLAAYRYAAEDARRLYSTDPYRPEHRPFRYVLRGTVGELQEVFIRGDGYVVHTLEAALWCMLNTHNFRDCVLKAINLGEDADTLGAVAGGLAGVAYGFNAIPPEWVDALVRKDEMIDLANRFATVVTA